MKLTCRALVIVLLLALAVACNEQKSATRPSDGPDPEFTATAQAYVNLMVTQCNGKFYVGTPPNSGVSWFKDLSPYKQYKDSPYAKIDTSSSKLNEADKMNGIEKRFAVWIEGDVSRKPDYNNRWRDWEQHFEVIAHEYFTKRNGQWYMGYNGGVPIDQFWNKLNKMKITCDQVATIKEKQE